MTDDDGFALQATPPAINAGQNSGVPAKDILFKTRVQQSIVDMGAYEKQPPCSCN